MEFSKLGILIANIFIALSFLVNDRTKVLAMVCIGVVWLIISLLVRNSEMEIDRMDYKLNRLKKDLEQKRFERLIETIQQTGVKRK